MNESSKETKQVNVRLPAELLDQIDARRRRAGITRDEWARRAFAYCLTLPEPEAKP